MSDIDVDWTGQLGITNAKKAIERPDGFEFYYPRKFREPQGWYSPRAYATFNASANCLSARRQVEITTPMVRELAIDSVLTAYKVPTWWVSRDLMRALIETKPPGDMDVGDLNWPMPGFLFLLPIDVTREVFGCNVPWIAGARIDRDAELWMPPVDGVREKMVKEDGKSGFGIKATYFSLSGEQMGTLSVVGVDSRKLSGMFSANWEDGWEDGWTDVEGKGIVPGDAERLDKATSLFVQLVLLLGSPNLNGVMQTGGELLMPALVHGKGKEKRLLKPSLFAPKWVGEKFRYRPEPRGGTHASPSAHWRGGHWRWQRHGPGRAQVKHIWIRRMEVGFKSKLG